MKPSQGVNVVKDQTPAFPWLPDSIVQLIRVYAENNDRIVQIALKRTTGRANPSTRVYVFSHMSFSSFNKEVPSEPSCRNSTERSDKKNDTRRSLFRPGTLFG